MTNTAVYIVWGRDIRKMKKLLTLILAAVLVFSLIGTAFAFTGITTPETSTSASGITVSVELVDYQNATWGGGYRYTPASGRAYAINELVGAVVTVKTPKGIEDGDDEGAELIFDFENIENITIQSEKDYSDTTGSGNIRWNDDDDFSEGGTIDLLDGKQTYKFFILGQLTSAEGGEITAKWRTRMTTSIGTRKCLG
jgi:hypothetical protein